MKKRRWGKYLSSYVHRSQGGLGQVLGGLEQKVMEALWGMREPASGREIYEQLSREGGWAYTTIRTVVDRLVEKGLVQRRKSGRMWNFESAMSREEFRDAVSREAVRGALELAPEATITQLVDLLADHEPAALDELSRLVERARAERGEE